MRKIYSRQAPVVLSDICPAECSVIEPATCLIQPDDCPAECSPATCPIQSATCPIFPEGCSKPKIVTGFCLTNNEFQLSSEELHELEELDEQNFNVILRREPLFADIADDVESSKMYGSNNEQNFGSCCNIQEDQETNFIHAGTPINTVDKDIIKEQLGARCGPARENIKIVNLEHEKGKAHEYQKDYEDMSGCQTEGFSNCDTETGLKYGC
ncbi:34315_t:CDS:2 [Racocetra persica]|uniref:34315_t:CDS:1 n=1 Tax=Racocetra persica TaxID=160502 RepID=A0ACA9KIA0_9GLOM|nr:34315_t:CDS:2 [Racocetra persica]